MSGFQFTKFKRLEALGRHEILMQTGEITIM